MTRSLQIVDSLKIGGAERMAVNIANALTSNNIESHICVTRKEGELVTSLNEDVKYLFLNRTSTFDIGAILELKKYIKKNKINLLHAHGTSFFIATVIKSLCPSTRFIWHDHHGNRINNTSRLKLILLKLASKKMNIIYCVNDEIKQWAESKLNCNDVKFISNFPTFNSLSKTQLNGNDGKRILYLANLRKPKNHQLLFRSFKRILEDYKDWSLHCVGNVQNNEYSKELVEYIKENKLENNIFIYGSRDDVSHIISQSNIGVLTSTSEGLPMALLEYGLGGLPVLSTNVGHCGKLISNENDGILIESNDEDALVMGLKRYINDKKYMNLCAENFHHKVVTEYSEKSIMEKIVKDYCANNDKDLIAINGI